ncbi:MAG: M20/M25/M40 family metallo-hydrolase, partial [Acidobacteriota bacterium]|nr:M20/M25/M40 family metallo-hydrolase [Acidobacteriota bacterium]
MEIHLQFAKAALIFMVLPASLFAASPDTAIQQLARDILKELIEINTTDSIGNTSLAAEAMAKRLREAGLPSQDIRILGPNERKGNLVARLRGTGRGTRKPILIIAHLDIVEARREDWTTDPFRLVEKDGYFYGRGTQDMKAGDAIVVATLIRFLREGYKLDRDIILALTADEEGGQFNGVDWLLKHHRDLIDAEYVLNPDSGGVYTDRGKPIDVEVEATEKLYADFELTAKNAGGHSSLPVPDNAIYHIVDALAGLERAPFPFELNAVTRAYFERLASAETPRMAADIRAILKIPADPAAIARLSLDPHYNATIRTTCVATRLNAGHANNALPQTAQAVVNCRILPAHSAEEVRQDLIKVFADPAVAVRYVDTALGETLARAPEGKALPPVAPKREVMGPLERIAATIWPGAPVVADMETGASDSKYTNAAGMPSYGFSALAIDHDDIRAHGKDERLRVSSFFQGVEFY